jgi:hypothetical protein
MTTPYVFTDEATREVLDILTSSSDQHDAHLGGEGSPPPVVMAGPPPLAAEMQGGAMSLIPGYSMSPGGYAPHVEPAAPGGGYAGYTLSPAPPTAYGVSPSLPPSPGYGGYGAGYKPFDMGPPGASASGASATPAPPPGSYKLPAQQPKPGENRVLRDLRPHYKDENSKALKELNARDNKGKDKDPSVVRYLNDQKREKYRVTIGSVLTRGGKPFDTKNSKAKYLAKSGGYKEDYISDAQWYEWGLSGLIWVCVGSAAGTEKPSFFSHVGKPHRFHHSSFNRGQGVIAAGEWIIKDGALLKISPVSGHYQPTMQNLYHAVLQLAVAFRDQATTGATTVFLFDKQTLTWIDYPVKEFIKAPSAGGRYAVNPNA